MHTRLVSWSRFVFLAGVVLAMVLVIPVASFPMQLSKTATFAVLAALAAVLFVWGGGARQLWRSHGLYGALLVLLLPAVYAVSYLFSTDRAVGLMGYALESDTVIFVLLCALAYLLAFSLFKTLRTVRVLTDVLFWSLVAAAVFQVVSIVFGLWAVPFSVFADHSLNVVGKWNDLGLLASVLLLMLCVRLELSASSVLGQVLSAAGALLAVALLAFINFPLAWGITLAGSVALYLVLFLRQRRDRVDVPARMVAAPWFAAAAALSILFLLYGSGINAALTSVFPVSSLEVRPGLQATLDTVSAERSSLVRTALGSGPNTFGETWLMQKPAAVNQTPFWNLDFNVGYSTLATAFGTTGFLGAFAWLIPLLLTLAALVRTARLGVLSREERPVTLMLALSSLALAVALALYVPSQNVILLAFVLSGAAFGFLSRQGRSAESEGTDSRLGSLGFAALALVLVVATVGTGALAARRFVAQSYVGAGLLALSAGSPELALKHAASANKAERTPDGARLLTDAGVARLSQIAQDTTLKQDEARTMFSTLAQQTISNGQAAIAGSPKDYRSHFSIARVYDFFATLKIEGAYKSAQSSYAQAAQLNPTSPSIPLAMARLEATQDNIDGVQKNLTRALELKPDYTDAILFVVQVNVAQGDLPAAIRNTKSALQSAPGVPAIWFELGLLYYAGNDATNAIPALEQALKLAPDYANAKYFLALAYYAQNRATESRALFNELAVSNPENAQVKAIIANLNAGKQPLDGLSEPTAQTSAPLAQ